LRARGLANAVLRRASRWLALGLIVVGGGASELLEPGGWCRSPQDLEARASELERELGVQLGVGPPEAFLQAIGTHAPDGILLTSASPCQAALALEPLRRAVQAYPPQLFGFFVKGVFLASEVMVQGGYPSGGTFGEGAIYLPVGFIRTPEDAREIELALHHEFSSFLYRYVASDTSIAERWERELPPGFRYAETREAELRAVTERAPVSRADEWYAAGFVHDYGLSSQENDVNTYAELLMADPDRLIELAGRWPRIAAKAQLLARFYARVDPALAAVLQSGPAAALLSSANVPADDGLPEAWRAAIPSAREPQP
jgi:hypothetical protein